MGRRGTIRLTPAGEVEALRLERVRIAGERAVLEAELKAAQAIVDAFPDRQREALVDQARGRGETVDEVEREAAEAQAVIRDREARIEALRTAEREIDGEQSAIEEANIPFFESVADERSRVAEAKLDAAVVAVAEAEQGFRACFSAWSTAKRARARAGAEALPDMGASDFEQIKRELADQRRRVWPGSRGEARWREAERHMRGREAGRAA